MITLFSLTLLQLFLSRNSRKSNNVLWMKENFKKS